MQSGGSFEVDYDIISPAQKVVMKGEKERQGDFVFVGQEVGEYRVCFSNEMSTFADKMVDFEIAVRFPHLHPQTHPSTSFPHLPP